MSGEADDDALEAETVDDLEETDDELEERRAVYLPTPEEIRQACLEIQAGWSDAERERRSLLKTEAIEPKVVRVSRSE